MEQLGPEPRFADLLPTDNWDFEEVSFDEAARILRDGGFPTSAIPCANDRVAFGVLTAGRLEGRLQSGLSMPGRRP